MGCSSCSSGSGLPKGCKNNGACGVGGCDKLPVFDWLSNMVLPNAEKPFDGVEIRFKNGRKDYFLNTNGLSLHIGDPVAVEASPGHDIGVVSLTGELVRMQLRKRGLEYEKDVTKKVYRKANTRDLEQWHRLRDKEDEVRSTSRTLAKKHGLQMKISDTEYQGDGSKITFYYTADDRIDFRNLIKDLAAEFSVRVEMRQIGARQEAAKLGGIGVCGRELCCSTWLTDFRAVNTAAARYQQLSLNPQKLAGQCGKLKCCLNYELDSYIEAVRHFPDTNIKLHTEMGDAYYQKMDIFKGMLWYAYSHDSPNWIGLRVEDVNDIIEKNKKGIRPPSLELFVEKIIEAPKPEYENVVGQDELTRFDKKDNRNRGANNNKKRRNNNNKNRNFKKNNNGGGQKPK